jgi:hypothetical protein
MMDDFDKEVGFVLFSIFGSAAVVCLLVMFL